MIGIETEIGKESFSYKEFLDPTHLDLLKFHERYMSHGLGVPALTPNFSERSGNRRQSPEWVGICPAFYTPLSSIRLTNHNQPTHYPSVLYRSFHFL